MSRRVRRLLRPGAITVALAVALFGAAQLAKTQELPSENAWDAGEPLGVLLLASGVVALVGGFLVVLGYTHALRKSDENVELLECCKGVWALVTERTGIDMQLVGVHVWTIRGRRGMRHLERRATFTIGRRRRTPVTWCKGKGAIGLAWELDEPVLADTAQLEGLATTQEDFCHLPRRVRFGLGWREFRNSRQYRGILALPLRAGDENALKVRGVLSVDVKEDGHVPALGTIVDEEEVQAVLSVCEAVIGRRA